MLHAGTTVSTVSTTNSFEHAYSNVTLPQRAAHYHSRPATVAPLYEFVDNSACSLVCSFIHRLRYVHPE